MAPIATQLYKRFQDIIHELGKFGVVGGISYLVDLGIFNLLLTPLGWFGATLVSTTVAATVAFIGNRYWTWRHRSGTSLHREYVLYFGINAVGLGIGIAVLYLSHNVLGSVWPDIFHTRLADNVAKMIIGMAIATAFRFWAYRRFVFVGASPAPEAAGVSSVSS